MNPFQPGKQGQSHTSRNPKPPIQAIKSKTAEQQRDAIPKVTKEKEINSEKEGQRRAQSQKGE